MTFLKLLVGAAVLTLSAQGSAFGFEGVYKITERQACDDEQIDSVTIVEDSDGTSKAFLASARYGIVYQVHAISISANGRVDGASTPQSHDAGTLTATFTEDGAILTGSVDAAVCPSAWTFTAGKIAFAARAGLDPLGHAPTLSDFVGSFTTETDRTQGTLRLVRLSADRIAGAFGDEQSSRILSFGNPVLNLEAGTIDLFSVDDGEIRVKWHLDFGQVDGVLAMKGYGISATGRLYPVSSKKL